MHPSEQVAGGPGARRGPRLYNSTAAGGAKIRGWNFLTGVPS